MRQLGLMFAFAFILFTGKIAAQEQKRVVDSCSEIQLMKICTQAQKEAVKNPEIQMLLTSRESIRSGELRFVINQEMKGKSAIETKEYKMSFCKTGKIVLFHINDIQYNLLNVTDFMQYVYDGKTWYIINHKKKTCEIDTNYCKISCIFPLMYPIVLHNEMLCFYVRDIWMSFLFSSNLKIEEMQKRENTTFVRIETSRLSPERRNDNKVLFTEEYEWDVNKSILLRYNEAVKDDAGYSRETVVKTETLLIDASLNDEKYVNADLYNGLNYAKSYKIKYSNR